MAGAVPLVGADLLFRFPLPLSHRPIRTVGHVRWANQGFAGVEFGDLSLQAQDEIWRYYANELARQRGSEVRPPGPSGPRRDPELLREGVLEAWRRFIREWEPPPS